MVTLKVRRIGNSLGVILPQEVLADLKVADGDELFALPCADGITLTAYDPDFEQGMAAFESFNKQYRNTLRALAE